MRLRVKIFLMILLSAALPAAITAQSTAPDDEDIQSWNDFQLTIPVHKKVELYLTTTYRFGENLSRFNEGRVGAGIGIKIYKAFSTAAGYNYIESRSSSGRFRTEHRYHVNGVYKFPFKKFSLSHRSQYEYRVRSSINAWRYRPSLTFEKALPEKLLSKAKFFVTEEPFYVSATGKFSRNRFSFGIKKTVNEHLAVDIHYLRQNDGFSHPGDLNVIGTSWKFNL
ncbi:hypothetical protein BH20ACI2_BH20ACI2_21300 [soil metagenome]